MSEEVDQVLALFFFFSLCREGLSDSNKSPVRCDKDWTPPCGGNQAQHRSWLIPSPQWSMVLLSAPERTFLMEKLAPQHSNLTPRWRFLFQQDDDIKRSWGNKGLASGRRRKSSRDPDLNPTEHLWRDVTLNVSSWWTSRGPAAMTRRRRPKEGVLSFVA